MIYSPIDCGLHDRLEALATVRKSCRIVYREPGGEPRTVDDRIVDVYARDGEEFLRTETGAEIRLDRLVEVDGVRYGEGAGAGDEG